MKIVLINPRSELVIHSLAVEYDSKLHQLEEFIRSLEKEQGTLDRVLVYNGTCRIMDEFEKIPIPIRMASGKSGA